MNELCKTYHEKCDHYDQHRSKCKLGKCFPKIKCQPETHCEFFIERNESKVQQ